MKLILYLISWLVRCEAILLSCGAIRAASPRGRGWRPLGSGPGQQSPMAASSQQNHGQVQWQGLGRRQDQQVHCPRITTAAQLTMPWIRFQLRDVRSSSLVVPVIYLRVSNKHTHAQPLPPHVEACSPQAVQPGPSQGAEIKQQKPFRDESLQEDIRPGEERSRSA